MYKMILGGCLEAMKKLQDNSIDSIVTDPPYGLKFMAKKWDHDVPAVEVWAECLRVLKPGGYLLAFAGTRTQHRMACNIEDAGFEIRDMIAWVYGSGFPKSLDVSKADNCENWQGWGTALKPALEPITMARKPLIGTVAANVLAHGTGAINVDGSRVDGDRWPANLIHDGSKDVIDNLPGNAPRFFYCPKTSKSDRNEGCDHLETKTAGEATDRQDGSAGLNSPRAGAGRTSGAKNAHPTVKPTELMRYLCRMVTQPGGIVLDPFMGSGSTGKAAAAEGFGFIGCEIDPEYMRIAVARLTHALDGKKPKLIILKGDQ